MNIKQAKQELKNTVRAYLKKDAYGEYVIPALRQRPILMIGPPGIGKTQIMKQAAAECGIGLVSYTITHHTRQSAVGLPFIREVTYGDTSHHVTEYTMSEIISSIYQYMEETGLTEGILFIDEINCVSETLAPTMLQFLQCKTFGNQAVPDGWIIAAAGNPPEYNKSVRDFDFVTLDRVRKIIIEADLPVFREYASSVGIHPFITSYLELRPDNFYKAENDIDGLQFVTARGWEDLSHLVLSYEELGIPVDEDVISQYLQHDEVAKDVAAYYDLYQKYRDEYDIRNILIGRVPTDLYRRLFNASFDEHVGCISLLTDGLLHMIREAVAEEELTDLAFEFLKNYKTQLTGSGSPNHTDPSRTESDYTDSAHVRLEHTGSAHVRSEHTGAAHVSSPHTVFLSLLRELEEEQTSAAKTGLLDLDSRTGHHALVSLLSSFAKEITAFEADTAFDQVRTAFQAQAARREEKITAAKNALEYAFTFMEDAFGENQEMVLFVTDLTMNPAALSFIRSYGCDRYYKYNQSLLIGSRRQEILNELEVDKIRASRM